MCSHLGVRKMEYSEELGTWLYDGKPSPLWESEQREKLVRPLTPADLGGSMEWVDRVCRFAESMGLAWSQKMYLGYSEDRTRHEPYFQVTIGNTANEIKWEGVGFSFSPWTGEFVRVYGWEG